MLPVKIIRKNKFSIEDKLLLIGKKEKKKKKERKKIKSNGRKKLPIFVKGNFT